jgi:hypothetical protein
MADTSSPPELLGSVISATSDHGNSIGRKQGNFAGSPRASTWVGDRTETMVDEHSNRRGSYEFGVV